MSERFKRNYLRLLVFFPVCILLLVFMQLFLITRFNERSYTVKGADNTQASYMTLDARADSTSTWLKRDFEWKGTSYDLKAQTIDGVLHNGSGDLMDNWSVRINILDDCFVNNAWCGTVEVHQYVGTDREAVQKLDLRNYEKEDVQLEYRYDGDLLIPLVKGDYVLYFPSQKDSEIPVEAGSDRTIGVIFYYFDTLDFMEHELYFTYHRTFTHGRMFIAIAALLAVWILACGQYMIALQIYKSAQRKLEDKKSGLLCMSEIYFAIYIIELDKDRLIPVIEKNKGMVSRPENMGAAAQLAHLFEAVAQEPYKEMLRTFCDLKTLPERLKDTNSIACEYLSERLGWCSLRFFVMDRIAERSIDRVLLTIQNIDNEKREMAVFEQQITLVENEKRLHGAFLKAISDEIRQPAGRILEYGQKIMDESTQQAVTSYAKEIGRSGRRLVRLMDNLAEYTMPEAEQPQRKQEAFGVGALVDNIRTLAEEITEDAAAELVFDIARDLPQKAHGDADSVLRVMAILIEGAAKRTASGRITVSVFGRQFGERAHLLFSVRDTGDGSIAMGEDDIGIRLACAILRHMGSELHPVTAGEEGNETYFEIDA